MDDLDGGPEYLLEQVLRSLRKHLGVGWAVERLPQSGDTGDAVIDARVQITPPDGHSPYVEVLVIVQRALTPRDVDTRIRQIGSVMRHADSRKVLLVAAPWIGQRTQQKLSESNIAYLDLTGNVCISLNYPSIRIYTHGASKAPKLSSAALSVPKKVTLAGRGAGRVVRFLTDFAPPYRAKDIASATGVGLPWVSRLLGQLEDQLLVRREGRAIVHVQWPDLLRARAGTYDLLRSNSYLSAVAIDGIQAVLAALPGVCGLDHGAASVAVTGSYAARKVAPLVVGGQLMLYVEAGPPVLDELVQRLGLLRAENGGDVLLLRAYDRVVFERTRWVEDIPYVALSQVVLDGLAGPGRMPIEAEQVLARVIDSEASWRHQWP